MNGKKHTLDNGPDQPELDDLSQSTPPPTPVKTTDKLQRFYQLILLAPGPIVSLSVLIPQGKFKKLKIGDESGASAAKTLMECLSKQGLGQLIQYRGANNTNVSYIFLNCI